MENARLIPREGFQTAVRGNTRIEYEIYRDVADDGTGHDLWTGEPLKTYDEWLES